MFFGMLLSLRSFLSPSFRFRSSCARFLHSPFLVSLLRPFLPLFLLSLSRGGGRRRARLSKENEGNDMMEGGLLQLLVTTSLHVSVWFLFLAIWGLLEAPGRCSLKAARNSWGGSEGSGVCGKRQCGTMSRTGPIVCTGSAS